MRIGWQTLNTRLIEKTHAPSLLLKVAIVAAFVAFLIFAPAASGARLSYVSIPWQDVRVKPPVLVKKQIVPSTSKSREEWLSKLEYCESTDNPRAINPRDRDGTPSYGLLQFKPSTFALYARAYGMASTTDFMDPAAQAAIVIRMMDDPSVDWHLQFPVCVGRLGLPPGVVE